VVDEVPLNHVSKELSEVQIQKRGYHLRKWVNPTIFVRAKVACNFGPWGNNPVVSLAIPRCVLKAHTEIVQKPSGDIKEPLLMTIKLGNVRTDAMLTVYAGNKVAIHNSTDTKVVLKRGLCLLGFGCHEDVIVCREGCRALAQEGYANLAFAAGTLQATRCESQTAK